jgi:molybdopterin-guanine dinucleotide biosynthesis protein
MFHLRLNYIPARSINLPSIIIKSMLTIAIQAGGASRRMGRDKALLPFHGQPLVERVLKRVEHLGDEILVTTNNPSPLRYLGVPIYTDLVPHRGALGGLYTALKAASLPVVAVVACDMPFLNPGLLAFQRDYLEETNADIVIPQTSAGVEPFHAIYKRSACLKPLKDALDAGKWRADAWFDQVRVSILSEDQIKTYDPELLSFWNVNTPEDYQIALDLAARIDGPPAS